METYTTTNVRSDRWFWISLGICIILLALPIVYRLVAVNGLLIGGDSYYNLRIASSGAFAGYDSLSFGGRDLIGERGWFVLLSVAPYVLSWILPFIFGIGSFIFFYLIVRKFRYELRYIAAILLASSPAFIYLFSTSTKYVAAVFFAVAGLYFILNKRNNLALVLFILSSLFSSLVGATIFIFLLVYSRYNKGVNYHTIMYTILLLASIALYYYKPVLYGFEDVFVNLNADYINVITAVFSDLGSNLGLGIFMFILSLFGIYYSFSEKYRYAAVIAGLLVLLFVSFYFNFLIYILNFFVVYFAAVGIFSLYKYKWKFDFVYNLVMLVIICGLLFSFVSYDNRFLSSEPTKDFGRAMNSLRYEIQYGAQDIAVISDAKNGHFITYAGAKNVVDSNFFFGPNLEERLDDINKFYQYTNADNITQTMNKYNAFYVWVDKEMYSKVWAGEEAGLLYFFKYGGMMFFDLVNKKDVSIWTMINRERFVENLEEGE